MLLEVLSGLHPDIPEHQVDCLNEHGLSHDCVQLLASIYVALPLLGAYLFGLAVLYADLSEQHGCLRLKGLDHGENN